MGVIGRALRLAGGVLDRAEVIEQEKRVGERVIEPWKRAADLEALALERRRRVDHSDHAPRLGGVGSSDARKTKRVHVDGWHRKRQRRKRRAYSSARIWLSRTLGLALLAPGLVCRRGGDPLRDPRRPAASHLAAFDVLVLSLAFGTLHSTGRHRAPPGD